jgi:flagellar biogenesis protein FliO
VIRQMLALFAVMALTMGLLQWLRRRGVSHIRIAPRRRSARRLELLEKLHLTPQHSLHVVRMDDRSLLIGVSPAGCALLESAKADTGAGEPA